MCVCVFVRARGVCMFVYVCVRVCVSMCVFVNCVWILSSKMTYLWRGIHLCGIRHIIVQEYRIS